MRKLILCIFLCLFGINLNTFAQGYDAVLGNCIKEFGVFRGQEGIVYANKDTFEGRELLMLVYLNNNSINCGLYAANDGEECVDTLSFAYGGNNQYTFSKGTTGGGESCVMLDSNGTKEVFILQADSFKRIYDAAIYDVENIVTYTAEGIILKKNPADVYTLLNSEKEQKISQSAFTDCKDNINKTKLEKINVLLQAVSDVVEFDSDNVDFIKLLKNILFTSSKYENITGSNCDYKKNSQEVGFEEIQSVDGDYIDTVLTQIFNIEPQHISVNNLIENGVCYTNARYFFTGGYTKDFSTEILGISALYDLGKGRYYVIFFDKYVEGGYEIPEYSYAIIDTDEEHYSLVKISMGNNLLSDNEIKEYSISAKEDGLFFKDGDDLLHIEKRQYAINVLIGIAIVAFCVAIVAIVFVIVLKKHK